MVSCGHFGLNLTAPEIEINKSEACKIKLGIDISYFFETVVVCCMPKKKMTWVEGKGKVSAARDSYSLGQLRNED